RNGPRIAGSPDIAAPLPPGRLRPASSKGWPKERTSSLATPVLGNQERCLRRERTRAPTTPACNWIYARCPAAGCDLVHTVSRSSLLSTKGHCEQSSLDGQCRG